MFTLMGSVTKVVVSLGCSLAFLSSCQAEKQFGVQTAKNSDLILTSRRCEPRLVSRVTIVDTGPDRTANTEDDLPIWTARSSVPVRLTTLNLDAPQGAGFVTTGDFDSAVDKATPETELLVFDAPDSLYVSISVGPVLRSQSDEIVFAGDFEKASGFCH